MSDVVIYPGTPREVRIKIPGATSALGVLALNDVRDGDEFAADGWVYRRRERVRKWFSYCEGWNHFWTPILDDLERLEFVYWKLLMRRRGRLAKLWRHVARVVETTTQTNDKRGREAWIVHAQPSLSEHQFEGQCWSYVIVDRGEHGGKLSYRTDHVPVPDAFRHLDLGNMMYELEQLARSPLLGALAVALDRSLVRYVRRAVPGVEETQRLGKMVEVQVDDRRYVYRVARNDHGVPELTRHVWQDDEYTVLKVHDTRTRRMTSAKGDI